MKKILSFFVATLFGVTAFAATETTVYYTAPESVVGSFTVKVNTNQQTNPDAWKVYEMTKIEQKHGEDPIYKATFTDMWDGVAKMQFQLYNGSTWNSQIDAITTWTGAINYNGKMFVHNEAKWKNLDGSEIVPFTGFFVTGDSALVVDAGYDKSKAWKADAIKSEKDTITLKLKATEYKLKVVNAAGEWKGFSDLTEKADGIYEDKGNICFTLKEAGEVQIIYFVKDSKLTFKLVGAFVTLEEGYYLNGTHIEWNIGKLHDYKFVKNEDNKEIEEYKLEVTLTKGQEIKPCKAEGSAVKEWYGKDNFVVTDAYTGKKVIFFRPEKNSEWTICDGHVYIEPNSEGGGETPEPQPGDAKFYITGDSALVVDAGLEASKKWDPAAIKSEKDTLVLSLKAEQAYTLKLTLKGEWKPESDIKGYSNLTEKAKGLAADKDNNIIFKLTEAGEVKVIYFVQEEKVTFKLEGKFDASGAPELADGYYLISPDWTINSIKATDKFEAHEGVEGEYQLSTTLTVDQLIKVVEVKENVIVKWYPEGEGNEYKVDASHAGARTIYFRPAGNEEWKGFIYVDEEEVGPTPDPGDQAIDNTAVEMNVTKTFENGQLIIIKNGVKYNANGALLK